MAATFSISVREELVHEPMHTWSAFTSANVETSTTLSGLWGQAIMGVRVLRSMGITRSYTASGSLSRGTKSPSLPWAFKKALVWSSEGKMEVVAPSSVPILVMVARSGTVNLFMPSPPHSMMAPTPPLTERICSSFRDTSLAVT